MFFTLVFITGITAAVLLITDYAARKKGYTKMVDMIEKHFETIQRK